jgi:L-proline 4-hydroxylase
MSDLDFAKIEKDYDRDGFVFLRGLLPDPLFQQVTEALPGVLAEEGPQRFFEDDGSTLRAVYGLHEKPGLWRTVSENSVITRVARRLMGEDMYTFQWKINPKAARSGGHWEWHRDFTFWHREDGMPAANAVTAAIFLDEVTAENGPMLLVPGSHLVATDYEGPAEPPTVSANRQDANWAALVSANLSHALPDDVAEDLAAHLGIFNAVGPAGSVLFFHCNLVHASGANTSDRPRTLGFITYNAVSNAPNGWDSPRPGFFTNLHPAALSAT